MISHHLVVVEVSAAATTSLAWKEISTICTWCAVILVLGFCFFNVNLTTIYLCQRVVLYEVLRHAFACKSHKTETSRRSCVNIFEDDGVLNFTKFHKVVLEFFTSELKVQAADEYLTLWVGELDSILGVTSIHVIFLYNLAVGVWFLDLLAIVAHHKVVMMAGTLILVAVTAMAAITTTLMVVSRLHVHALVHDVVSVAVLFVSLNYSAFSLQGLILVGEAKKYKSEATTSLCCAVAHHNCVLDFAKFLEVVLQVLLRGREGQTAYKEFDLILFSGLMERCCRAMTSTVLSSHVARAKSTRACLLIKWQAEGHHRIEGVLVETSHLHLL